MVKFSKTRFVYWNNNINELNSTNANTVITVNKPNAGDQTLGYLVAKLPGTTHNWHFVPVNQYPLYLSENEWFSLLYNNKSFRPKHMKISIAHTIPTARYTSTNTTTQLSFNNTIFSIIYENSDVLNVISDYEPTPTDITNFCRTYDGATYTNNHRNLLPTPNLLYKIPDERQKVGDTVPDITDTVVGIKAESSTYTSKFLSIDQRKLEYIPEFLRDNNNVSVLYPGENQFLWDFDVPETDYALIECGPNMFNEPMTNLDIRAQFGINTNVLSGTGDGYFSDVYPKVRYNNFTRKDGDKADNLQSDDIYFDQSINLTERGPTEIWIKGCPILDANNSLVSHTFFATITWEIEIETNPNELWIPRPLVEGWCVSDRRIVQTAANTFKWRTGYSKKYPLKYTHQTFLDRPNKHKRCTPNMVSPTADPLIGSFVGGETAIENYQRFTNTLSLNNYSGTNPADSFEKATPATVPINTPSLQYKSLNPITPSSDMDIGVDTVDNNEQ